MADIMHTGIQKDDNQEDRQPDKYLQEGGCGWVQFAVAFHLVDR